MQKMIIMIVRNQHMMVLAHIQPAIKAVHHGIHRKFDQQRVIEQRLRARAHIGAAMLARVIANAAAAIKLGLRAAAAGTVKMQFHIIFLLYLPCATRCAISCRRGSA